MSEYWTWMSGNQWHSVALRGNQWQSVAISGTQWQSVAIRGTQRLSKALHGEQWRVLDLVRRERQALVHYELAQVRRVEVACGRLAEEPFALERE
jgi:hypothetical protein